MASAKNEARIRPAQANDAAAIARVHVETWRSAYRGIVSDAYLDGLSPAERAGQWRDLLEDREGTRFMLVAHDEGDELIGFAAAGPERAGDPKYRGELYALYVLPSSQGRGVGRGLTRGVAARLAAGGTPSMLAWVLEANAPARRFYEALGGAVIREQPIDIGGTTLREIAYGWLELEALGARALYFEDFKPGDRFESARFPVSDALIIEFGRLYDPQVFHTDPEAAKTSGYGGLIASGLQTLALTFKLFLETGTLAACSLGSPGLDEIRWKAPVRPGDTLHVVAEVLETRPSTSKPDRGIVRVLYTTVNQRGETVMTLIGNQLCRRRPG